MIASGEASYYAVSDKNDEADDGVYTNTCPFGSGTNTMSVAWWMRLPSDSDFFDASVLRAIWGFGSIFTGEPTVAAHGGMWSCNTQTSWLKNDIYTYDDPADADDDFGREHLNFAQPSTFTGTGPYGWHHYCVTIEPGLTDGLKSYVDGVLVDTRDKQHEYLTIGSAYPGLSVHGAHVSNSNAWYGCKMSIADFRIVGLMLTLIMLLEQPYGGN